MNLKYYKSESDIKPSELDTESSQTTVYFRRNIKEVEVPDEGSLSSHISYEYEEAKVPRRKYLEWLSDKNQADIEYLYMMTEVDYLE